MSNEVCAHLPRFTHAGQNYDRWYCVGCMAVMFLPHGDPPPDEHMKGENILPKEDAPVPVRVLITPKLPIEIHTDSLPGDVSIVKKDE